LNSIFIVPLTDPKPLSRLRKTTMNWKLFFITWQASFHFWKRLPKCLSTIQYFSMKYAELNMNHVL